MAASTNTRRLLLGAGSVVVVLGLVFVAINLWLGSEEAVTLFEPSEDLTPSATDDVASDVEAGLGGTWAVGSQNADGTAVGYRIIEDRPVGGPEEVVGRTSDVSGFATIVAGELADAEIVVQLEGLRSGNDLRDGIVANDFLEVPEFPTATLTVSEAAKLALPDVAGELASFDVAAELTVHGVTQPVGVVGQGQWQPGLVEIVGTIDITLGQFGVERPSLLGRSTRDEAVVEFKLLLIPSGR